MKKSTKSFWWILICLALVVVAVIAVFNFFKQSRTLTFTEMISLIETGIYDSAEQTEPIQIEKIIWDAYNWTAISADGESFYAVGPSMYNANADIFALVDKWSGMGISISYTDPNAGSLRYNGISYFDTFPIASPFLFATAGVIK